MKYDNIEFGSNDYFNMYLLFKYLSLEYIANGATEEQAKELTEQLIIKYKDNLFDENGLAYALGERNFEFYCLLLMLK